MMLKWQKVNRPKKEGGLVLRQLKDINLVIKMKLAWSFLYESDELSRILRFKFMDKDGAIIIMYKKLTIWA